MHLAGGAGRRVPARVRRDADAERSYSSNSTTSPTFQRPQLFQRLPGKGHISKILYSLSGDRPVLAMEALHPNELLGVGGHQDQTPR